jgi:hypothetical protein
VFSCRLAGLRAIEAKHRVLRLAGSARIARRTVSSAACLISFSSHAASVMLLAAGVTTEFRA